MMIYVASSWRNKYQPSVVAELRKVGFEVYDFRHPIEDDNGFRWSEIDSDWENWTLDGFIEGLGHPLAIGGFTMDFEAMQECNACVLVMPCGRSAHLECGWFVGQGRATIIYIPPEEKVEPELMYLMNEAITSSLFEVEHLLRALKQ